MKRALLMLALVLPAGSRAEDKAVAVSTTAVATTGNQPVVLEPMTVYGDTRLSFGFGIRVMRVEKSHLVLEMLVDRVRAGSEAERKGLKPGSRIVSIEGKDVASYEATFVQGSELNRLFVDRPEGASVTLQVLVPGKKKLQKVTIFRQAFLYDRPKIGGLPN